MKKDEVEELPKDEVSVAVPVVSRHSSLLDSAWSLGPLTLALALLYLFDFAPPCFTLLHTSVPSRPHFRRSPAGNYSSFECIAGSQSFDFPLTSPQQPEFPAANAAIMRTCLLRDVCFIGGELSYFVDDKLEAAAPSIASSASALILFPGFLSGPHNHNNPLSITFKHNPRPAHPPFAPTDRTYLLGELSFVENFGHLIIDTILPAFAVADVYGLDMEHVQLLDTRSCETVPTTILVDSEGNLAVELCRRNLERWAELLLVHPLLQAPISDSCYERLIVGHAVSFSLTGLYAHRASAIRAMRKRMYERLGMSPAFTSTKHTIMVLEKKVLLASIKYPGICKDVRAWAERLHPTPDITCIVPGALTVKQQLQHMTAASLVVAEHGTTTYLSLFQKEGSSLLVVVPDGNSAKEVQTLLFNTDVQAWYFSLSRMQKEGAGALFLALERAGKRLGLPPLILHEG